MQSFLHKHLCEDCKHKEILDPENACANCPLNERKKNQVSVCHPGHWKPTQVWGEIWGGTDEQAPGRAAAKGLQPRAAARNMVTTKPENFQFFQFFRPLAAAGRQNQSATMLTQACFGRPAVAAGRHFGRKIVKNKAKQKVYVRLKYDYWGVFPAHKSEK